MKVNKGGRILLIFEKIDSKCYCLSNLVRSPVGNIFVGGLTIIYIGRRKGGKDPF
jgi:hypothetical protein